MAGRKDRMCARKMSFPTYKTAKAVADSFGQRTYECPICFCFHNTSKEKWQDEFVPVDMLDTMVQTKTNEAMLVYKKQIKDKNKQIITLEIQINRMKKLLKKAGIDYETILRVPHHDAGEPADDQADSRSPEVAVLSN